MQLSYAQNLEDYHLDRVFAGQEIGAYVDVGGGHPGTSDGGLTRATRAGGGGLRLWLIGPEQEGEGEQRCGGQETAADRHCCAGAPEGLSGGRGAFPERS